MGEGWSDWYAKDFIVGQFPALDTGAAGEVHMGDYVGTIDPQAGARLPRRRRGGVPGPAGRQRGRGRVHLRRLRQDRRRARDPRRRRDLGADAVGPARARSACAEAPARLITQAMRLSPPEPSFLDARNAILLAADAGASRTAIWDGVRRARDGLLRVDDRRARTSRRSRTSRRRRARRAARDDRRAWSPTPRPARGSPGRRVRVGGSPDLVGQTGADGRYAMTPCPGARYRELRVHRARLRPGDQAGDGRRRATTTLSAELRRNWASCSGGASVGRRRRAQGPGLRLAWPRSTSCPGRRGRRSPATTSDGRDAARPGRRARLRGRPGRGLRGRPGAAAAERPRSRRSPTAQRAVDDRGDADVRRRATGTA